MKIKDAIEVSLNDFIKIVEKMVGVGRFDTALILYEEQADKLILYFSDGLWKYYAIVTEDKEKFKAEKLTYAIKLI